jgi:hypothetical protein
MLTSGHIKLETFREDQGLFPDPDSKTIRLNLLTHSAVFEYDEIYRAGSRQYTAEGSSLQITRHSEDEISIQYTFQGNERSIYMHYIPQDIGSIAASERQRRDRIYADLRAQGETLGSSAYGTIRLLDNRRFFWDGYASLVPNVIPTGAGTSGIIRLGVFVADELEDTYDGALRFHFTPLEEEDAPVFLYTRTERGLRLTYAPESSITDSVVMSQSLSPVVIFFSYS